MFNLQLLSEQLFNCNRHIKLLIIEKTYTIILIHHIPTFSPQPRPFPLPSPPAPNNSSNIQLGLSLLCPKVQSNLKSLKRKVRRRVNKHVGPMFRIGSSSARSK